MFTSLIFCPVAANSYTLTGFICQLTLLVLEIVPVLVALALLVFVWGLALFVLNSGSEEGVKKGRERMIWGLVALFVILSIGGIIAILMNTFFGASSAGFDSRGGPGVGLPPPGIVVEREESTFDLVLCALRIRTDCR